uniref:Uncharacterized protein n=1 Tax=viral metagenome TaxID=1070528 RepID=A0A6H1ZHV5_9ZZZZ
MKKKKKPRTLIDIMADNPDNKKFHLSGPMRQKTLNDFSEYLKRQTASVTGASYPTQFTGLSQAATPGTGAVSGSHSHTISTPYYTATGGIFTGGTTLVPTKTIFDEDPELGKLDIEKDTKIYITPSALSGRTVISFLLTINSSEIDATNKRQSAKNIVARLKQAMEALSDICLRELWWKQ